MRVLLGSRRERSTLLGWFGQAVLVEDAHSAIRAFCGAWDSRDPFDCAFLDANEPWSRLAVARFRFTESLLGVDQIHPLRVVLIGSPSLAWHRGPRVDGHVRRPLAEGPLSEMLESVGVAEHGLRDLAVI